MPVAVTSPFLSEPARLPALQDYLWNAHRAYHSENLEGLHSMLEKELWHRIPSSPAGECPANGSQSA